MKIGAAAALVGAIVAEVTKSEDGGLGARLLAGSYYGQTVQIWAALFAAAALSGALVGIIGLIGRLTLRAWRFRHERRARSPISRRRCCSASSCSRSGRRRVRLVGVPAIILPAPSAIGLRLVDLRADAGRRFRADHPRRAGGLCRSAAPRGCSSPS